MTTSAAAIAAAAPEREDPDGKADAVGRGPRFGSTSHVADEHVSRSGPQVLERRDRRGGGSAAAEDDGGRGGTTPALPHRVDDARDVGVVADPADGPSRRFERHRVHDAEDARHSADLVNLRHHGCLQRHGDGKSPPARLAADRLHERRQRPERSHRWRCTRCPHPAGVGRPVKGRDFEWLIGCPRTAARRLMCNVRRSRRTRRCTAPRTRCAQPASWRTSFPWCPG